jgi:hypothetical protein
MTRTAKAQHEQAQRDSEWAAPFDAPVTIPGFRATTLNRRWRPQLWAIGDTSEQQVN